jgi:hypothetical protein
MACTCKCGGICTGATGEGKQTTRRLNHRFIVAHRVNEEQRVLLKLLVENLNDLLSSPDVGLVASVWKAANTIFT